VILNLEPKHLNQLSPSRAVEFFAKLLWAEARHQFVPLSAINVSFKINVADGGIDASVKDSPASADLIRQDNTSYQIKTGDFKPWNESEAKKLIFGDKVPSNPNKGDIGVSIRNCLDSDGTFAVVCFGTDPVESQQNPAEKHLKEIFSKFYSEPKIEIWGINKLLSFFADYPSLCLELNGMGFGPFYSVATWRKIGGLENQLIPSEVQKPLIEELRKSLKGATTATHTRILGEPGIGKTRCTLEALQENELASSVIYVESAERFLSSELESILLQTDSQHNAILVIDECSENDATKIWRKLKNQGKRLQLLTIFNEENETGGEVNIAEALPLKTEEIKEIIKTYKVPDDEASEWAELCDGSPRVAHVIGWNLANNPSEPLRYRKHLGAIYRLSR